MQKTWSYKNYKIKEGLKPGSSQFRYFFAVSESGQKTWSYKNYEIKEGLKPGSSQFRYFFAVSESGEKKCNYCVWIVDDAVSRFDESKDFNAIVSSQIEAWHEWVKEKIDAADFSNRALKFEKTGEKEIDLSEMKKHVTMD